MERRRFNQLTKEHDSLDKSHNYASEIEKHGDNIINSLFTQGQTLKKVKNRTMQMLSTIGISEGILKMIEKRSKTDMVIFFVMAFLTILLIYLLVAYVKPMLSG